MCKQANVMFDKCHVQGTFQGTAAAGITFTSKLQSALEQGLLPTSSCMPCEAKEIITKLRAFQFLAYVGSPVIVTQLGFNTLDTPDNHATDRRQSP